MNLIHAHASMIMISHYHLFVLIFVKKKKKVLSAELTFDTCLEKKVLAFIHKTCKNLNARKFISYHSVPLITQ